jgi:hypothetical protein
MTLIDDAHAAMTAAPEDDAARLRFYERIADAELLLLLAAEAEGETLSPRVFPLDEGPVVLAFDTEERLAEFTGAIAPYAAFPGRVLARLLADQGIGLGVNLGVAPSSYLVPAEGVAWLAGTLEAAPEAVEGQPQSFHAPRGLPESLVSALDAKLARAGGLASAAWLAAVTYHGGRRGHLLAFVDAASGAEAALARAAQEALVFSGIEAGEIDVAFLATNDSSLPALSRAGLRFDLPAAQSMAGPIPAPPGSDPTRPPRLK